MTPSELRLWTALIRRATLSSPDIARAILRAFAVLRDSTTDAELARLVQFGYVDQIVSALVEQARADAAYQPVRDQIRRQITSGFTYYARDIPLQPSARTLGIRFDYLNPKVIDAVRTLETRVITELETATRETVRAFVENGLRDGVNPRTVARDLRGTIGLGPSQAREVANFRDALLGQNGRSLTDYTLRDKRLDRMLAKGPLTSEQVDRYTELYRKRRIALNAETVARTAALDAQKLAHQLSWQAAVDQGFIDGGRLMKQWIGVNDSRERPSHVAMNNEVAPFDLPYSNGQMVPGSDEFNCRCISRFYVARA